ncbi:hypothetical protein ACFVHW_04295 [Streptomyces sp. NPDC127110]|uniref:hypothetical protein n=1 Tax=Streptomyces sp. NPDC127110 TaxID=3345362 RepID=UPI003640B7A8
MNVAVVPQLDVPHPISRPMEAEAPAYLLSNADRKTAAAPVSGALVRSLLASALYSRGSAALEPGGTVVLTYGQIAGVVPGFLGPVFRAVPCARPPFTPCCAQCGHWRGEHDHPAVPTACTRYRLRVGPARFAVPEHDGVSYAWVRRMGSSRFRFEISEPNMRFPGGTLAVHRFPALGEGPAEFCAHFVPIPPERRAAVLACARSRVYPQPC